MKQFSDAKSTADNKSYTSKTVFFFKELEQCRQGSRIDQEILINNFKQLIHPPSFPYGPLMAYLYVIYKNMSPDNLINIRYLLSLDNSFLSEVLQYRNKLAKECFKDGNPIFYQFLHEDCALDISHEFALNHSCVFGNIALVKYLVLEKKAEINCEDPYHLNNLMLAVCAGKNEVFEFLLNNHADVFMSTELGTVLHYAISKNNVIALCRLLKHLRDNALLIENIKDRQGVNLIHSAIKLKSSQQILKILSTFFDVNIKDDRGYNLLTYSCLSNNIEAADYFAQNYANLKYETLDVNGCNALHLCSVSAENHATALWLVESQKVSIQSQINNNDKTALHLAAINNNYNVLDALIKYAIRTKNKLVVNMQDIKKRHVGFDLLEKPLMHRFLKMLIHDTDLDLLQKDCSDKSFLEYVIEYKEFSIFRDCLIKTQSCNKKQKRKVSAVITKPNLIIQVLDFLILELVEKRDTVDIIEEHIDDWVLNGQTILHLVCLFWPINQIKEYIDKYSPDLSQRNADGQTVISTLLLNGKMDVLLSFIDLYNPRLINIDKQNSSLLHLACELQDMDLVEKCLTKNLLAVQRRNDFTSPLDISFAKNNHLIFVTLWGSISEIDKLNYFFNSEKTIRQYLQENNLYEIPINFIVETIQEEVLTEDLLEMCLKYASEEDYIFKYYNYLLIDFVNQTIQTIIQETQTETSLLQRNLVKDVKLVEKSNCDATLSKQDFLAAVIRRDYNFFRDIRDSGIYENILSAMAIELLRESIKTQDQQLTLILLNFSVIEEQSYLNDNCVLNLAKINKQSQVIERLLKVPNVQKHLVRYAQKETLLPGAFPVCWYNPKCQIVILKLSQLLQKDKYKTINLFNYGSSIFKFNPNDLDLLIPNTRIEIDLMISEFIAELCALGAKITVKDSHDIPGYCSPRKNPVRRVIPIDFLNCKLEIVLSTQSIIEHANGLLTTITAAYFNVRELQMFVIPGIKTFEHIQNGILDTVIEPELSFSIDFGRVLRLLLMLASCPGFNLSTRCFNAIFNLFSEDSNLFLSKNYNFTKLHRQLAELFSFEYSYNSIFIMYKLNVLPKLIDFLFIKKDEASRIYGQRLFEWQESIISSESNLDLTYDKPRVEGGFSI